MLQLPDLTLVVAEGRPALAAATIDMCCRHADFGDIVVDLSIASNEDCSHFMSRRLLPRLRTSHALVAQWDGFILDPDTWTDDFLRYDYIGTGVGIGGGGFSLRSKSLLTALTHFEARHSEDIWLGHYKPELEANFGIRFGTADICNRWGYERSPLLPGQTFGFHGLYNLDLAIPDAGERLHYLQRFPLEAFRKNDAIELAYNDEVHGDWVLQRYLMNHETHPLWAVPWHPEPRRAALRAHLNAIHNNDMAGRFR